MLKQMHKVVLVAVPVLAAATAFWLFESWLAANTELTSSEMVERRVVPVRKHGTLLMRSLDWISGR